MVSGFASHMLYGRGDIVLAELKSVSFGYVCQCVCVSKIIRS